MSNSFVTPWTAAHQAPLSMGFPRQEYCSRLPFPSPGDLPSVRIEPTSPALAGATTEPPGKPLALCREGKIIFPLPFFVFCWDLPSEKDRLMGGKKNLLVDICVHKFSSVAQSCPTLCNPMNHSTPDFPVHHQLLEFTQTHVRKGAPQRYETHRPAQH